MNKHRILNLTLSLFMFCASVANAKAILTCPVRIGNHQEISVEKSGENLVLLELDNSGRERQRELTQTEFQSGKIQLFTDKYGGLNTLTQVSETEWLYHYVLGKLDIKQLIECY